MNHRDQERLRELLGKLNHELVAAGAPRSIMARVDDVYVSMDWMEKHAKTSTR